MMLKSSHLISEKIMLKQEASHDPMQPGRIMVGRSSRNTDAIVPLVPIH